MLPAFFISAGLCWLIVLTKKFHSRFTFDSNDGPQKVHIRQVPRVGGLAIVGSLLIVQIMNPENYPATLGLMIISILPVFFMCLSEDLTKIVSPIWRLISAFITGLLFLAMTEYMILRTNIDFIDVLLEYLPLAGFLTVLAIATLINGINLIDGLNGLSLGTALLALCSISIIADIYNSKMLYELSLVLLAVLGGTLIFNFPFGIIFIGDGGAYLIGGLLSMLVIMLPIEVTGVSPFVCLSLVVYPLYELLRTIIRRLKSRRTLTNPDNVHLHSLVFLCLLKHNIGNKHLSNTFSALLILIIVAVNCVWAVLFHMHTLLLIVGLALFVIMYEFTYFWARKTSLSESSL